MNEVAYPRLIRRIQAVLIDSVVLGVVIYLSLFVVWLTNIDSGWIFSPALSIEPILLSTFGATVGHKFLGLWVRKTPAPRKLNILVAYWRFVLKTFLGLPSLIVVLTTRRHRAIHDLLSNALVVYRNIEGKPVYELLGERIPNDSEFIFPSPLRRVSVAILYVVLASILLTAILTFLVTDDCFNTEVCSNADDAITTVVSLGWWCIIAYIVVSAWRGKLYGCRKAPRKG